MLAAIVTAVALAAPHVELSEGAQPPEIQVLRLEPKPKPWAVRAEIGVGLLAYDGVHGPDTTAGGVAFEAGLRVRYRWFELGPIAAASVSPIGGAQVANIGGVAGVSIPVGDQRRRARWRVDLLAEAGRATVGGAGSTLFGAMTPAPPVSLPYAGGRLTVSLGIGIGKGDARLVLALGGVVRRDIGERHTSLETDYYTISGWSKSVLYRVGFEL